MGQPKRSRWRDYKGPDLVASTVQGVPLGHVTFTDDTCSVLTRATGEVIVRIDRFRSARFWSARFSITAADGREVGTAGARGLVKSLQLSLRSEQGRGLHLSRASLMHTEWHLTEAGPDGRPGPEVLGRVTMSTIDSWIGLEQYVVEMDSRLDAAERRTVVASVVCLHRIRRPPGNSTPG
ncbi:hypothetical protein [Streptomyces sp. NPDC002580]|uniref:hypothetical protein n=1 Tax=Streptomyces sp. NPDC002580 TaxID=3364653 RepID=UPI0036B6D620